MAIGVSGGEGDCDGLAPRVKRFWPIISEKQRRSRGGQRTTSVGQRLWGRADNGDVAHRDGNHKG